MSWTIIHLKFYIESFYTDIILKKNKPTRLTIPCDKSKVVSFAFSIAIFILCYCISMLIYNHMQNIWNKLEKSSKTGQGKKSLMSTFACFLTATAKV